MTNMYGAYPGECNVAGAVTKDPGLCFSIEGADSRIIPHIVKAYQDEVKRVVICSLVYRQRFFELEFQEPWVKLDAEIHQLTSLGNNLVERSFAESSHSDWVRCNEQNRH